MRREGFELSVSSPRVLLKKNDQGEVLEPFEEVIIDVDEQYSSTTVDSINKRKGEMIEMKPMGKSKNKINI